MTRLDYIKTMDAVKAGRYICDVMEDLISDPSDPVCDVCPWREKCKVGHNGVTEWLMEEVEDE